MPVLVADTQADAVPIHAVTAGDWPALRDTLSAPGRAWAQAHGFAAEPGAHLVVAGADGAPQAVLFGLRAKGARGYDPFLPGKLATALPAGLYRFADPLPDPELAALALELAAYRFARYRAAAPQGPGFVVPEGADLADVQRIAAAVAMGRDLVNTPANDLGPAELEAAARALADRYGASFACVVGDDLIAQGFPMIHAVGRAAVAARAPRLIDITWGRADAPKVTLVGKGVCFDTGGLNLKPDASMLLMKKDMGGAAAALAAAAMVMDAGLDVRLRVLVPAVENAVAGDAFRPGDVLASRKGLSVEIGNTDAEGRLVLADALALADAEAPDLLIDYATLTGAARVALGPDLPPFYSDDEALAADALAAGASVHDPVWRMPLWAAYDDLLKSKIADVNHISSGGMAGSITAALFLRRFVEQARAWAHLDVYAWTPAAKPGRPEGGEVQGARLTYALLKARYG